MDDVAREPGGVLCPLGWAHAISERMAGENERCKLTMADAEFTLE